jgi:molecular chaperone GrpE
MAGNAAAGPEPGTAAPEQGRGPAPGGPAPDTDLGAEVAELTDRLRRALADLDNTRKRAAREAAQVRGDERARVMSEWLPVLDNLDLALEHSTADSDAIVQGVRGVLDQALAILTRLGYPRRADLGVAFDPARHEAVAGIPDPDAAPGTVLQVVRPGYGDDERQLRPASVVVATRAE